MTPRRKLHPRILPFGLALALAAGPAPCQAPAELPAALLARALRVPLHTQPADAKGGAYGLWAAGAGFKASFHDGFAFYPALGTRGGRGVAFRWRTESMTVGGVALPMSAEPVERTDEWRHEIDRGSFVEAYDVLEDGVEQTFVVPRLPEGLGGELVVTGRVETAFRAAPVPAAAEPDLVFETKDGAPAVRYGRAVAIDAGGARRAMSTVFDGERIRLRLDAAFLRGARFPLTIDPLTTAVVVGTV